MTKPSASASREDTATQSPVKKRAAVKNGAKSNKTSVGTKSTPVKKHSRTSDGQAVKIRRKSAASGGKKQNGMHADKSEKKMERPSTGIRKRKKKDPNAIPVTDKGVQTGLSKATQTRDWSLPSKEAKFLESLKEEAVATGNLPEENLNLHPVDIRIPQLTLSDILKYAAEHSCEIRIS